VRVDEGSGVHPDLEKERGARVWVERKKRLLQFNLEGEKGKLTAVGEVRSVP